MNSDIKPSKRRPIKKFYNSCRERLRRTRYLRRGILAEEKGNEAIKQYILQRQPAAIGKIGSVECNAMVDYFRQGKGEQLKHADWGKHGLKLYKNAGVFPQNSAHYFNFCQHYELALEQMDLLSVWFTKGEPTVVNHFCRRAQLTEFSLLSPIFALKRAAPWMRSLQGKKILVIHPFAQTIQAQYLKREKIWPQHPEILPEFTLKTLKIPMAASIAPSPYTDWTHGLEDLKSKMDQTEFDVALIGAGAWSLPLATHAKARGKIGIHTGGATQIFFGIKGRRWEKQSPPEYYNEAWERPSSEETPETAHTLEKACYW